MGKHTPGPWSVIHRSHDFHSIAIGPPGDQFVIAEVFSDLEEADSTARLVAAAPDLLEALKCARRALAFAAQKQPECNSTYEIVDAAIAKATGAE